MTKVVFLFILLMPQCVFSSSLTSKTPNLVLVTIDGLRWTDVLNGADPNMINSPHWVLDSHQVERDFWREDKQARRERLLPFVWTKMVSSGVLIGRRSDLKRDPMTEQCARNDDFYQGLFLDAQSPTLWTQAPRENRATVLTWLHNTFPPMAALGDPKVTFEHDFFDLEVKKRKSPWPMTGFDSITYRYAKQSLFLKYQKVTYVSFGATDMYLHEGEYGQYLYAARRIDGYIEGLWTLLQVLPQYRNNTILVVVNAHTLRRVSSLVTEKNSDGYYPLWFAAMGPGVNAAGEIGVNFPMTQTQISEMLLVLLKENPGGIQPQTKVLLRDFFHF